MIYHNNDAKRKNNSIFFLNYNRVKTNLPYPIVHIFNNNKQASRFKTFVYNTHVTIFLCPVYVFIKPFYLFN